MKKLFLVLALVCALVAPTAVLAQHQIFETVNGNIATPEQGAVRLEMVEWITTSDAVGQTVFFNDRGNKQLGAHWVPNDPRNNNGAILPWGFDQQFTLDTAAADQSGAIIAAMQTWEDQSCSDIPLTTAFAIAGDFGFVQSAFGFGGGGFLPFLVHAGWLPAAFFDALAPNGSNFILAVTFTLVWIDGDGNPTDIDNNGRSDVATREIYYNDNFTWGDGNTGFDIETIALHEAGHGLSQGHFGKAFRTLGNGKLHFASRAVMNATYSGVQRDLAGTDNGGHCSIWGSWPNN